MKLRIIYNIFFFCTFLLSSFWVLAFFACVGIVLFPMYIEGVIAIACFEMVFHGMPTMITINAQSSLSLPYAFVFAFLLIARMWAGTFVRSK